MGGAFEVPGNTTPIPFDFCVAGFADAADISGAPASISGGGLAAGTLATKFGRAKVRGTDGKSYVVQNNAWNPNAPEGSQRVSFQGNSFTVTQQSNGGFGNIPVSFPSIFIGRNGNRGVNDTFTTTEDDGLPAAINTIGSIATTFVHNSGATIAVSTKRFNSSGDTTTAGRVFFGSLETSASRLIRYISKRFTTAIPFWRNRCRRPLCSDRHRCPLGL
jgi:hypothetical protein